MFPKSIIGPQGYLQKSTTAQEVQNITPQERRSILLLLQEALLSKRRMSSMAPAKIPSLFNEIHLYHHRLKIGYIINSLA